MTNTKPTRGAHALAVTLVPFIILLAVGLIIIGSSAPFWKVLLVAVVAGVVALGIGQGFKGLSRR